MYEMKNWRFLNCINLIAWNYELELGTEQGDIPDRFKNIFITALNFGIKTVWSYEKVKSCLFRSAGTS